MAVLWRTYLICTTWCKIVYYLYSDCIPLFTSGDDVLKLGVRVSPDNTSIAAYELCNGGYQYCTSGHNLENCPEYSLMLKALHQGPVGLLDRTASIGKCTCLVEYVNAYVLVI